MWMMIKKIPLSNSQDTTMAFTTQSYGFTHQSCWLSGEYPDFLHFVTVWQDTRWNTRSSACRVSLDVKKSELAPDVFL
ncbi:hypothetical protein CASFOL_041397 [Castilleja foliolosa]|uniref:Uncharacterized protein n=1 Tax=Castilleja foliolosa TaxID=1961234 RepID=A0ABD3BB81_9LAMI